MRSSDQGPGRAEQKHGQPGEVARGGGLGGGILVVALPRGWVDGGDGEHFGEADFGRVEAVGLVDLGDLGVSGLDELDVDTLPSNVSLWSQSVLGGCCCCGWGLHTEYSAAPWTACSTT